MATPLRFVNRSLGQIRAARLDRNPPHVRPAPVIAGPHAMLPLARDDRVIASPDAMLSGREGNDDRVMPGPDALLSDREGMTIG